MLRIGEFSLSQIQQFLSTQNPEIRITQLSAQKQLLKEKIKESRLILHELEEHLDEFERTGNIMRYQNRYPITLKQTEDLPRHLCAAADERGTVRLLLWQADGTGSQRPHCHCRPHDGTLS